MGYRRKLSGPVEREIPRIRNMAGSTSGGSGAAPDDAQYLTLAVHADLTSERVFTPGFGLTATDGGAGAAYDLVVNQGMVPTWTALHTFSAGITLNGASGANNLTIPDNTAIAVELLDAGGLEYLRIVSTDAQPIILFNEAGADVDFHIEASGVADAFQVQGSDGQITFGALGAGVVQSSAGGVLSSAAVPLTDLASYAEGSLIIGGAADWEALAEPGATGYALVSDGTTFAWDQTPAWTGLHTFAAGITFNGASGANNITIPDNVAIAVELLDAGGTEYLRIVSTDARPVILFNEAGIDIDFHVEAVGVADALQVQGSDGQIRLGALGAGVVQSTAVGILSSAAVPLVDIAGYAEGSLIIGGAADWEILVEPGVTGYALVSDGTTFAWDQTPTWTGLHSFAAGITFNGASGANNVTVPDNVAIAVELLDAGGLEYMRIVSTDAQPIVLFNEAGVDVDFHIEASGVADALQVQGSDGQITLGVLGAGFVQSTAGGILSSAAIGAGDLPAHDHSGGGQGGSLTVGTTDTDAAATRVFFAGTNGVLQVDAGLTYNAATDSLTAGDYFTGDGGQFGISGNELLTVNAAGNFTFSGVTSVVVPDGCWVGADAACSWMFDSTNGDITTLDKVGIGIVAPDGTCHVHTATAGAVAASGDADELIAENSGNAGISILAPDANYSSLYFGSPSDSVGGRISWLFNLNRLRLGTSNAGGSISLEVGDWSEAVRIDADGNVGVGTTGPIANLAINASGTAGLDESLYVYTLYDDRANATTSFAANVDTLYKITATRANYVIGINAYSLKYDIPNGETNTGYNIGITSQAFVSDVNFAGTINDLRAIWARVGINVAAGAGARTVTNAYGVYIENLTTVGTITNNWGLYQASAGADNYFAGSVGIGDTSPDAPLDVVAADAVTAAVTDVVILEHVTSGTAAANFGAGILYQLEDAGGTSRDAMRLATVWENAGAATNTAEFRLDLVYNGTLYEAGVIVGRGAIVVAGNQRGDGAVDWGSSRGAGTEVASGVSSTIGGGASNTASGAYACVPGGISNVASNHSCFAAGYDAHATHANSMVFCATLVAGTVSWAANTWTVRCHGGARFYSAAGVGTGVQLSAGGNAWAAISDASVKADLRLVGADILMRIAGVPIYDYSLVSQDDSIRHIGPIAQDFNDAFGFTEDPIRINMLDISAVALAGVQALITENEALKARVTQLEYITGRIT